MDTIINWLLEGDVSVQYLTHRDLIDSDYNILRILQASIEKEGYGFRYLSCQNENGHWGLHYYQPKWTCTHYSLLDMKNLGMPEVNMQCRKAVKRMFVECTNYDKSINLAKTARNSDVCLNGMILNYASYFGMEEAGLNGIVDFLLGVKMPDGGFNCDYLKGDVHSSTHTTISVLEGFREFKKAGHTYKLPEIEEAEKTAVEFLLRHRLFLSERTGEIIDKRYLKLAYPYRYRYDCLRALEYLATAQIPYDSRMDNALQWLAGKRKKTGMWHLETEHPGKVHFEMEKKGQPSRFITLKALYIIKHYAAHLV